MANVFQKALFRTPKYNVFPQENEVKLSYEIGKLIPVQYWDLGPGDSIKSKISQLTRFAPMLAPVYQRYKLDFHVIATPHRLAIPIPVKTYDGYMDGFESFHNLAVADADRPEMPHFSISEYCAFLSENGINPIGTLFDYLGYPTFEKYYRALKKDTDIQKVFSFDVNNAYNGGSSISEVSEDKAEATKFTLSAGSINIDVPNILWWIANGAPSIDYDLLNDLSQELVIDEMITEFDQIGLFKLKTSILGEVLDFSIDEDVFNNFIQSHFGSVQVCADVFMDGIFAVWLKVWSSSQPFNTYPDLSMLPLFTYWSDVYDWYINTNLELNAEDKTKWFASIGLPLAPDRDGNWLFNVDNVVNVYSPNLVKPYNSYWANDPFTSAFISPQSGNAVRIPANGTIADLRNANSLQEFMEKLIYSGKRAIDVIKTIFGVSSSDARLDRTQVIGTCSFNVNISDISQTSQSDLDSQLGVYAGQGISVGKNGVIDFQAEEHTLVMVFMRIRPNAVYESALNHLLIQTDPYDFLIPDFAQVGEQPVLSVEVDSSSNSTVFGYQRRYWSYMYTLSHVHGEFKTSLDFWHSARRFDNRPSLNKQFAQVTEKDDLDRIFAVPGAKEHIYTYLHFDTYISRPLGKFVEYSL